MSYTPNTWQDGDIITAEKLNNMEGGIDNAVNPYVVTLTPTAADYSGTMDKTNAEVCAAYLAGKKVIFRLLMGEGEYADMDICGAQVGNSTYPKLYALMLANSTLFAISNNFAGGDSTLYYTELYPLTPMNG